jgi:hypothetical protein
VWVFGGVASSFLKRIATTAQKSKHTKTTEQCGTWFWDDYKL